MIPLLIPLLIPFFILFFIPLLIALQDLLYYANQIPTLSTQLTILASVKAASSLASEKSHASDAVIVKNIQNLTQAVARTLRAAEGACMQVILITPRGPDFLVGVAILL